MSWKLAILLGAALIAFAGYLARQEHAWLKSARVVPGTVVELIPIKSGKGRTSYTPRIRYNTGDGTVHDFLRPSAPGPIGLAAGDPVAVAYHDATPQDLRILTFGQFYGFAVFLAVLGVGLILLGAAFLVGYQFVPRVYLSGQPLTASSRGR